MFLRRFSFSLLAACAAIGLLALGYASLIWAAPVTDEELVLENNRVRLVFLKQDETRQPGFGVRLGQIEVLTAAVSSASPMVDEPFSFAEADLWSLRLRTSDGVSFTLAPGSVQSDFFVDVSRHGPTQTLTARWHDATPVEQAIDGSMDVTVTISLGPDSPYALWRIDVENNFPDHALYDLDFPRLAIKPVGAAETNRAALPCFGGRLVEDPVHSFLQNAAADPPFFPTPHMFAPLQLFTYYDVELGNALYLATHDGKGYSKRYDFRSDGQNLHFGVRHYPSQNLTAGNDYQAPYPAAIGALPGDWWDAAKTYRSWALQQEWADRGPIALSDDFSPRLKEEDIMGVWEPFAAVDDPFPAAAEDMERWARYLETERVAGLWYGWHHQPMDTGWPEYEPVQPTFPAGVQLAHNQGNLVWPYIGPTGWDVSLASYTQTHAADFALKDETGAVQTITLPNGAVFALMDPATTFWQEYVRDWVLRLQQDYDVDGIYLDVWSGDGFALDYAPNHGHPTGGGAYFAQGMRKEGRMIRNAARARDPGFVMMSEHPGETYIDLLEIENNEYLGPLNPGNWWTIPLFGAVYHDYIMSSTFVNVSATNISNSAENTRALSYGWALRYIFGNLLAVNGDGASVLKDPIEETPNYPAIRFFKDLALTLDYARDYLYYGERLRDLPVTVDMLEPPSAEGVPFALVPYQHKQPAVFASVWRSVKDGSLGLAFVNWTAQPRHITFDFSPAHYDLSDQSVRLYRLTGDCPQLLRIFDGAIHVSETLPPRSTLILAATTCPPPQMANGQSYPGPFSLPACRIFAPLVVKKGG